MVGRLVCHNFKFHFPCSYRSYSCLHFAGNATGSERLNFFKIRSISLPDLFYTPHLLHGPNLQEENIEFKKSKASPTREWRSWCLADVIVRHVIGRWRSHIIFIDKCIYVFIPGKNSITTATKKLNMPFWRIFQLILDWFLQPVARMPTFFPTINIYLYVYTY